MLWLFYLEWSFCHKKQKLKNKKCVCGADLDKLKRQKEKVKYWNDYRIPYKDEYGVINCREFGTETAISFLIVRICEFLVWFIKVIVSLDFLIVLFVVSIRAIIAAEEFSRTTLKHLPDSISIYFKKLNLS